MHELADEIIKLRLATRKACMCEGSKNKSTISLKTKVLSLIQRKVSTKEILLTLLIAKTNLALLTRDMVDEGLIVKTKSETDRREVVYAITDKGTAYLNERKRAIEDALVVDDEEKTVALIKSVTALLSDINA